MTRFGVSYHPMTGYFLIGMHDSGVHYTFMHLSLGEFQFRETSVEVASGGRLQRFSTFAQRHAVHLTKPPSLGKGESLTAYSSPLACRPDWFLERLKWIDCNATGKWSISLHPEWQDPTFWITFEHESDADAFRVIYGLRQSGDVIQFTKRVG
jgi:hypothetical protein